MYIFLRTILLGISLFFFTTHLKAQNENLIQASKFIQSLDYNVFLWEPNYITNDNLNSDMIPVQLVSSKNDTTFSFLKILALSSDYRNSNKLYYLIPEKELQNEQYEIRTVNEKLNISYSKISSVDISSTLSKNDVEMKMLDFKEKVRLRNSLRQDVQNYRESRYIMPFSIIGYGILGYYGITNIGEKRGATFLGVLGTATVTIGIGFEVSEGIKFKRNKKTLREINWEFNSY